MNRIKNKTIDHNSMESSIVFISNSMNKYYVLSSSCDKEVSDKIIKQMKKHLINFYKKETERDSIMIYLLWQEFRELYEKWMDN